MGLAGVAKLAEKAPAVVEGVWVAGVAWVLVGAWRLAKGQRVHASAAAPRVWAWGLLVVVIGAVLRLWAIDTVPRYVHCDEGTTVLAGLRFFEAAQRDWFGVLPDGGSYTTMNLCYALAGIGAWLGGFNMVAARAPDVVLGILSIWFLFDGLQRTTTLRLAVVGALLLAVNHCHLHYSRIASSYIQSAFVVSVVFSLFGRVWAAPTYVNAVLLGIVLSLGVQTYRASTMTLPLLLLAMAVLFVLSRQRRRLLVPLTFFGISCATAASPFGVALWRQGPEMADRARELNIFSPHKMAQLKRDVYHTDSAAEVVLHQAWTSLRGFHRGEDHQPQYGIAHPMADRYTAALMVPGAVLALVGLRHFVAANAFVFTIGYLLLGLGMQWAPGYNRTTGALPLAMVFPAIAAVQCCSTFWGTRSRVGRWARDLSLAGIVAGAAAINARMYLVDYPFSVTYGDESSEAGWAARQYAGAYTIHLVNWPSPGTEGLRLILGGTSVALPTHNSSLGYLQNVEPSGADLFIISGEDPAARDAALARFPEARLEEWRRDPRRGPLLYLVFVGAPRGASPS
jgi:hypothetical protein